MVLTGDSHLEENFSFLKEALDMEIPGLENSNCFDPRALGLPWPTTFPASVQSKHWRDAREAAHEILTEIRSTMKGSSKLGLLLDRDAMDKLEKRYTALVDTVTSCAVNMFPAGNAQQARILSKTNLIIFLHDGMISAQV